MDIIKEDVFRKQIKKGFREDIFSSEKKTISRAFVYVPLKNQYALTRPLPYLMK